jgi:diguanylate cyclase (GGDEF)-like protein/PAS domain S-box-containing protein
MMIDSKRDVENLNYIFDNAKIGIAVCSTVENIIEVINPAFASIYGYEMDELIGRSMCRVFTSDCKECDLRGKLLAYCTTEDSSFETTHSKKDGSTVDVSVFITVIKDKNNEVQQRIVNIADITKRKSYEKILQETNSKLEAIIATIPDMIWIKDKKGDYLTCNKSFGDFFHTTPDEVVGKNDYDFFTKEAAEVCRATDLEALQSDIVTFSEEIISYPKSNNKGILEVRKIPVMEADGDILGVLGIGRDITEQREIEKNIAIKEKEFRSLAENLPDNIVRFDKDGNYLYLNPTHEQTLGCKAIDVLGKSIKTLFPHHTEVIGAIEKIQKLESDLVVIRQSVPGFNGTTEIHEVKVVGEKNDQGELVSILGIGRDITGIVSMHEQLTQAIEIRRGIINSIPDLLFEMNRDGDYLNFWFHDNEMMHDYRKHLLGKNIRDILPYEAANIALEALAEADKDGISLEKRYSLREDDTLMKWYELSISKKSDGNFLALVHEITSQVRMQEELKKQKDFQDTLLRGVAKAGMSVNVIEDGRYIYTNNVSLAKEYGYDEMLSEKKPSILETIHPEYKEKVAQIHQKRLAGEEVANTYSIVQVKPSGEEREHEISVVLIPNSNPIQTLVVSRDVTEQKNIERRIEFMAHHDILTGLANKAFAQKKAIKILEDAKLSQEQVAFLFLDLDGFKVINDTLGHSVGDSMLKSIALHLKQCVRENDIVSRQGGDEFLIILQHITNRNDIFKVIEKIFKQLEEPFQVATHILSISASIGISLYPDHGKTFETLFKNADAAMYQAKEYGKNGYRIYTSHMNHNMIGRFKLHSDLKNALQGNEFMLHYQPQVDVVKNKIIGVEALIRWNHPQMGLVPPLNFIPIAESSGLIIQIGQWVIEEACRQMMLWHQQGCRISIAVNISAIQFKRGDIENVITQALQKTGLDPKYLELELTETIMMHDVETTLQTVQNLKLLGVQLSIDDFGTGYSSLSYLKRFAVDKLKIDQSFVRGILNNKEDSVIVKTIIQMAKNLNLKTIAEGVEDAEVLSLIEQLGCDEVQGYHFAKPMNALDFDVYYQSFL